MKRRLLLVAIFLLAGAVVNVAVAWVCVAWIKPRAWPPYPKIPPVPYSELWKPKRDFWEATAPWFSDLLKTHRPPHFPYQFYPTTHELGLGLRYVSYLGRGPKSVEHHVGIVRIAGWPVLSMQGSVWVAFEEGEVVMRWSLAIPPRQNRWLPLRPIWPGFAVNTVFYAAVLWLLIPGPFVLRRLIRIKRGRCGKCGYPMGESDVCSECGKELPRRKVVTT